MLGHSDSPARLRRYEGNPDLASRVYTDAKDAIRYISMNLAEPPFNDVHVRRAVNLALDKAALVRFVAQRTGEPGEVATHIGPDGLENDLLVDSDVYQTPHGDGGSLAAAAQEMAKSRYDSDHDGVCDSPVCRDILAPVGDIYGPAGAALVAGDLRPLGLILHTELLDFDHWFRVVGDPRHRCRSMSTAAGRRTSLEGPRSSSCCSIRANM